MRDVAHLEQLATHSAIDRDPRARVLATAYLGLVPSDVEPKLPADTAWHPVDDLPRTAFDHHFFIDAAVERLRAKLSYTNIGFALAPAEFTIAELRDIISAALGYEVGATNLTRVLTRRQVIDPTERTARPGQSGGPPRRGLQVRGPRADGHRPVRRTAPTSMIRLTAAQSAPEARTD